MVVFYHQGGDSLSSFPADCCRAGETFDPVEVIYFVKFV